MARKLIYILNHYSADSTSHFTHILHLLEVMASKGCDIVLLIEKADGVPSFSQSSIRVERLSIKFPVLRHLEMFVRLVRLVSSGYKATFVRIAAPAAIVASAAHGLCGGKSYLWQSGTTYEHDVSQPRSLKKFYWWLTSYIPNVVARACVDGFVTGPESMVDYYADVVGVPRRKIIMLYNDIDTSRFSGDLSVSERARILGSLNISEGSLVLLLVHRLSPVRRTLSYIEPMLKLLKQEMTDRPWVLVVAGGGGELGKAKELVELLGVNENVLFLGDVPNRRIHELYSIGDIFVNPTYTEGFPRVLIEAMASGLPIVTTNAGGASEILGDTQRKYLVRKENPEDFARATLDLVRNESCWNGLSEENFRVVRRFSTEVVSDMYIRAIFQ